MNDWAASIGTGRRLAEAAGWLGAAALVLAVHAGGAWWLARKDGTGTGQAFVIELAPSVALARAAPLHRPEVRVPDAPASPLPPDAGQAAGVPPADLPVEHDSALPLPPARPAADTAPPAGMPPAPMPAMAARVPRPVVAPPPPGMPLPPPRPERPAARPSPGPETAAPARTDPAPVAPAPAAAAGQAAAPATRGGKGAAGETEERAWAAQVNRKVAGHMLRWRNRIRERVTIEVVISIDGSGRVSGARIAGSTGDRAADASIAAHAARLARVPAPPDGRPRLLQVPVTLAPARG